MKNVHVVFKTHLDIGFTDLAETVLQSYIREYIPNSINLAEKSEGRFIWTTGSWLISYFLKCPEVPEYEKNRMRSAIQSGLIRWHGLPVTTHTELMDEKLFEYGLSIFKELDKEFHKKTIASKMTDVPGHTIAIVPLMAKTGLKYLHIGVNASSAMPAVPEMFVWRARDGSEIIVHYAKDYGQTFERDGWEDILYFAHSHDNQGPPKSLEEINQLYETLAKQYPDSNIIASSLDDFAKVAWERRSELPIIEEEIADSWIHGIASDPKKVSNYRNLLLLRDKWLLEESMTIDSQEYKNFSDYLLLIAEHTWGGNGNVFLPDYRNYRIKDFENARAKDRIEINKNRSTMDFADLMASISTNINDRYYETKRSYALYEKSWQEQRNYINQAIFALEPAHQKEAMQLINKKVKILDIIPERGKEIKIGKEYIIGDFRVVFSESGGLKQIRIGGYDFLQGDNRFGELSYERFDFHNYNKYLSQYSRLDQQTASWALVDFAKRGIEAYPEIQHEIMKPIIEKSALQKPADHVNVIFDLSFRNNAMDLWGVPKIVQLVYTFNAEKHTIDVSLKWKDKKANRMPEAYWFETTLDVLNPYRWQMHKLGEYLSPYNVLSGGNRDIHALTEKGLKYTGTEGEIDISSREAPLVSFGHRGLLNFDNKQRPLNNGIFVNLYNNVWGTNFPAWFEDDMTFHFNAKFDMN
ncbi:DUF5054 domain-containing protein [Lederbergia ruris]|uniref:Glycoside hydrolase family 38 N-terminal domain-containing protein n=1 Tax=Lederbergia ruris TaxID=217495 RepID=A0ABQ4KP94_9BACI|nr:DUF5054 domain-containing protein [Lederbergia ruris]GIN59766.1 hypothetical protein J8TS2_40850 [Lederbergia ruris]